MLVFKKSSQHLYQGKILHRKKTFVFNFAYLLVYDSTTIFLLKITDLKILKWIVHAYIYQHTHSMLLKIWRIIVNYKALFKLVKKYLLGHFFLLIFLSS
jgi:hypothetical protein